MKRIPLVTLLLLSGCATSTGIMTIGNETYSIVRRDEGPFGSLDAVKAKAYKDATGFCAAKQKAFKVITNNFAPRAFFRVPTAEITFTCVEKS